MKTQDLTPGQVYKSNLNSLNTYRYSSKMRANEYAFTSYENGQYLNMVVLNSKQIVHLF